MTYDFLVETYETERIKVVSVWSEFKDDDLPVRPRHGARHACGAFRRFSPKGS